jgi:hypothetical protein
MSDSESSRSNSSASSVPQSPIPEHTTLDAEFSVQEVKLEAKKRGLKGHQGRDDLLPITRKD